MYLLLPWFFSNLIRVMALKMSVSLQNAYISLYRSGTNTNSEKMIFSFHGNLVTVSIIKFAILPHAFSPSSPSHSLCSSLYISLFLSCLLSLSITLFRFSFTGLQFQTEHRLSQTLGNKNLIIYFAYLGHLSA